MIKREKFDHFQMLFQMRFSSRVGCWITGGSGSPLAKVPRSGPCINGPSMTCRGTCSSFLASQVATKISHGIQWNERNLTGTPAKFDARNLGFNCRKNGKLSRVESRNLGFLWFPAVFLICCCPIPNLQSASSSVSPSMNLSMPLMSLGKVGLQQLWGAPKTDSTYWDNCLYCLSNINLLILHKYIVYPKTVKKKKHV